MQTQHQDSVKDSFCQCGICLGQLFANTGSLNPQQPNQTQNSLHTFLQMFPRSFPLLIAPTACPKTKLFYYNRSNRLAIASFSKVAQHFPLAINIVLFYSTRSLIAHKYEILKEDASFCYVQAYTSTIPFMIHYHYQELLDVVLQEKLPTLVKNLVKDDYYEWTPSERDFLIWVQKDYGDTVYSKMMVKIYCLSLEKIKKHRVISGKFEWLVEKPGLIRLQNVTDLVIEKGKKLASFQEEYEQKILERLSKVRPQPQVQSIQFNLLHAIIKPVRINSRVNHFKNQIRDIFQQEKLKILKKTEKERTLETTTLSDDVARLFLPQLHKYSNLREVLSDEQKFKKVVLGIDTDKKIKTLYRRSEKSEIKKTTASGNKSHCRHYRSQTQY